jgi:iron(III) transport system substrate-binding protein
VVSPAHRNSAISISPEEAIVHAYSLRKTAGALLRLSAICAVALAMSSARGEDVIRLAQVGKAPAGIQAELDALIKGAKAEGEVTWYSSSPDTQNHRVADAFFKKYGVKAQIIRLSSTPLQQRYAAEATAGNIAADVVVNAGNSVPYAEEGIKNGWVESISAAGIPVIKSGEYPAKYNMGPTAIVQITPWLIGYNTEKVQGADIPRDWRDLLKPKFKGQYIMPDPRVSDAYLDVLALLLDRYGEPFFNELRAQNIRLAAQGSSAIQALGAGEGLVVGPTTSANVMTVKAKGAPVNMVAPDLTSGVELQVMLTARAKARHPNAARLFANYVLSREGNTVYNDEPAGVTMYDASGLPKDYQSPKPGTAARKGQIYKLLGLN